MAATSNGLNLMRSLCEKRLVEAFVKEDSRSFLFQEAERQTRGGRREEAGHGQWVHSTHHALVKERGTYSG